MILQRFGNHFCILLGSFSRLDGALSGFGERPGSIWQRPGSIRQRPGRTRRCSPNWPVLSELAGVGTPPPPTSVAFPSAGGQFRLCWVGVGSPPTEQCGITGKTLAKHTHTHTRIF